MTTTLNHTSTPIPADDRYWIPLGEGVWAMPLRFDGTERTLRLKVLPGTVVGRHKHEGFVHALNISGKRQLGSGEIAGPGDYIFEPVGNEDSWACVGDEPCIIHIVMSGRLTYVDQQGNEIDYTDTPKLRDQYLAFCKERNLTPIALGSAAAAA
ncbi:anti-sigma factor [Hwanghaeella grinnelliae]|uniref:Anti-sigma factor n=1 Tax=Hwanghaeella grinnelliae TaxID=2500179 RepID=A0A3S2VRY5_9PROT|nr:cupin domain-containing protein [Hwanghaeella grinnelliae]RVU39107.1 anti-sigma factor [Hwanghaeella grinnelliae]